MSLIELFKRHRIIEPRQPDITDIDNLGPRREWALSCVHAGRAWEHALAADPDAARSESSARSTRGGGVKRCTQDSNVVPIVLCLLIGECVDVGQIGECFEAEKLGAGDDVNVVVDGVVAAVTECERVLPASAGLDVVAEIGVGGLPRPR